MLPLFGAYLNQFPRSVDRESSNQVIGAKFPVLLIILSQGFSLYNTETQCPRVLEEFTYTAVLVIHRYQKRSGDAVYETHVNLAINGCFVDS